jgi:pyruvate carboxylase
VGLKAAHYFIARRRDIFRVFDSLNYIDNLRFGIDTVCWHVHVANLSTLRHSHLAALYRQQMRQRCLISAVATSGR